MLRVKNHLDPTISLSKAQANWNDPINTEIGVFSVNRGDIWNFSLTNFFGSNKNDNEMFEIEKDVLKLA